MDEFRGNSWIMKWEINKGLVERSKDGFVAQCPLRPSRLYYIDSGQLLPHQEKHFPYYMRYLLLHAAILAEYQEGFGVEKTYLPNPVTCILQKLHELSSNGKHRR